MFEKLPLTVTVAPVLVLGGIAFAIGLSLVAALICLVRPHTAEGVSVIDTTAIQQLGELMDEVDDAVARYLGDGDR